MKGFPAKPWARPWQDVVTELDVSVAKGLDPSKIEERRSQFGPNRLREVKRQSGWAILVNQFKNLIVAFLLAATAVSFAFGEHIEGAAISVVILINAAIGFITELRGIRSVEALRKMGMLSPGSGEMAMCPRFWPKSWFLGILSFWKAVTL